MLHLFNVFRKNDGNENCAQVLEEEVNKMFGSKTLNDKHDRNIVSVLAMNIHDTNDDCTSHDKDVSYKHVNFWFVKTCLIGMIDFARSINMMKPIGGLR